MSLPLYTKTEKDYLKNSILKPYLIHVEFEVENVLNYIQKDNLLKNIYKRKGFNVILLENSLIEMIKILQRLQNIFIFN